MHWLRKNWFEAAKFFVTTIIAIAAVWIGILQYRINSQLRDFDYFKFFTPNIGESFDPATWKLTLTNYGQSPIFIDSQMDAGAKFPMSIKATIFPGQSTQEDLHPFLALYNLIPPQGSTTLAEYKIFFMTADTNGPLYVGQFPIFLDNFSPQFHIQVPIQTVYVQQLKETSFKQIYQEISQ